LIVVGAVFLLLFLGFFFATGAAILIAAGFPAWAAIGTMTVILLIIGGVLAGLGAGRLRGLDPKPHRTMAALQQNINWLKGQRRP
jgi:apolipoprotein N-acyltransferase